MKDRHGLVLGWGQVLNVLHRWSLPKRRRTPIRVTGSGSPVTSHRWRQVLTVRRVRSRTDGRGRDLNQRVFVEHRADGAVVRVRSGLSARMRIRSRVRTRRAGMAGTGTMANMRDHALFPCLYRLKAFEFFSVFFRAHNAKDDARLCPGNPFSLQTGKKLKGCLSLTGLVFARR